MDEIKRLTLANNIEIQRTAPGAHVLRFKGISKGWRQHILLRSDAHHDSRHCDRRFEREHLLKAQSLEALIMDFGDAHDAMQGKGDPRGNLDDLMPEYKTGKYLDALCDIMVADYSPFAKNWVLMAQGNHESSVLSKKEVDLTERVVAGLRRIEGCEVQRGGYTGWVAFKFTMNKTRRDGMRLFYSHGFGGESANTVGVGQIRGQSSYLNDVDFLVNGHSHNAYHVPMVSMGLSDAGVPYDKVMHALRIPGYKSENRKDSIGGYAIEKGLKPKPIGAIWIELEYSSGDIGVRVQVDVR